MDRGGWWATVHRVAKSLTRLKQFSILVAQTVKCLPAMRETCCLIPGVGKIPWRRKWPPTPVLLPRKFHGWRSVVVYSPWGRKD